MATRRLAVELAKMAETPTPGIVARPREGNLMLWDFAILGPAGTPYEHGVFTGELRVPSDYPLSPPKVRFTPPITHPNVYGGDSERRGEVCISVLHVGADATGYERPEERWSPVQSINSVLLSIASMLGDVNTESPANVDAAKMYLRAPEAFRVLVRREVERSLGLTTGAIAAAISHEPAGGGAAAAAASAGTAAR